MRTKQIRVGSSNCTRHGDRAATAHCDDCGAPMCPHCAVNVPSVGTYCVDCAMRRGGVRARHLAPVGQASASVDPLDQELEVRRYDEMVAGREERPLISGLTERLVRAGVDPTEMVDDAALQADVGRLQADANQRPARRRWWTRRT